jgi:hypothetical protein
MKVSERHFLRGYLVAVSNLMRAHDGRQNAEFLLGEVGCTEADARAAGLDDYDLQAIKPAWDMIEERDRYRADRAALAETE